LEGPPHPGPRHEHPERRSTSGQGMDSRLGEGIDMKTDEQYSPWRSDGTVKSYKTCFPVILQVARKGDAFFQNFVGYCFDNGRA